MHLGKIKHVSDAVVSVLGIDGSLAEETGLALRPHLVEFVFVLVHTMPGLVFLQDLVQTWGFDSSAPPDHCLAVSQEFLLILLLGEKSLIDVELVDEGFAGTGIEDIDHAGLDHLVQPD